MRSRVAALLALLAFSCSDRDLVVVISGNPPPAPGAGAEAGAPSTAGVGAEAGAPAAAGAGGEAGAPEPEPRSTCSEDCGPTQACWQGSCVPAYPTPSFATGIQSTCFIAQGTLYCWGNNQEGQLGVGDTEPRLSPTAVGDASDWLQVSGAVGLTHCGVRSGGLLACWGENYAGAVGTGDLVSQTTPFTLTDPAQWITSEAASGHTCAIAADRSVYCWGRNVDGDLGQGDLDEHPLPSRVPGDFYSSVSTGWGHACAIRDDASLWCWGRNVEGQLGTGDTENRSEPVRVGSDPWRSVRARGTRTFALRADGALYCWGENTDGQCGTGDAVRPLEPTQVAPELRFSDVSGGVYDSCALSSEGAIYCWGNGNTATVSEPEDQLEPALLDDSARYLAISSGMSHHCALREDGALTCWGANGSGQLGLGDDLPRETPTEVSVP